MAAIAAAGYKVGVMEQVEGTAPATGSKKGSGLVQRRLVNVVTPATDLGNADSDASYLLAICYDQDHCARP